MMKKRYIVPSIDQVLMEDEVELLNGSVTGGNGIGYGGVDTEGSKDPDARWFDLDEGE